jgi:TolB protein
VTHNGATDAQPACYLKIAFQSDRTGNWDLFLVNFDGTHSRRVTSLPGSETEPTWSSDGTRLAFVSNQTGSMDIYSVKTDGTDLQQLTTAGEDDYDPAWWPS